MLHKFVVLKANKDNKVEKGNGEFNNQTGLLQIKCLMIVIIQNKKYRQMSKWKIYSAFEVYNRKL